MPPDFEPAQGFHRVKVAIIVQQCVVVFYAVSGLQHVDRAGYGDPAGAQLAVVLRGGTTDRVAADGDDVKRAHYAVGGHIVMLVAKAAKHLKQGKVCDGDRRGSFVEQFSELLNGGGFLTTEEINPHA